MSRWWALTWSFSDPCISVLLCAWCSWVWSFLKQFLQTLVLLSSACTVAVRLCRAKGESKSLILSVSGCAASCLCGRSGPWEPCLADGSTGSVTDYVRICLFRWLRLKFSPLCLVDHCSSIYSLSSKVSSWCVVHLYVKQFLAVVVVVYFIGGKKRYKCYGQSVMFNQEFTICHHTSVYVSKDCSTTERLCLFIHPLYP